MARKPEVSVLIKARDTASRVVRRFQRGLSATKKIAKATAAGVSAVTASVVALGVAIGKTAERGNRILAVRAAFQRVGGDIEQLRAATGGLISDFDLMVGMNSAIALGSARNTEEFGRLARVAQNLGRALGIDAQFALESLNTGISRQSKLYLDNLGIILDVDAANAAYAASLGKSVDALSESERKLAFRNAALQQAEALVNRLGVAEDNAGTAAERATVKLANLRDELTTLVAESPTLNTFFSDIADVGQSIVDGLKGDADDVREAFSLLGHLAGQAFKLGVLQAAQGGLRGLRENIPVIGDANRRAREDREARLEAERDRIRRRGTFGVSQAEVDRQLREFDDFNLTGLDALIAEGIEASRATVVAIGALGRSGAAQSSARAIGGTSTSGDAPQTRSAAVDAILDAVLTARGTSISRVARGLDFGPQLSEEGLKILSKAPDLANDAAEGMSAAAETTALAITSAATAVARGSDQIAASVVDMITRIASTRIGGIAGLVIGGVGSVVSGFLSRSGSRRPEVDISDASARKIAEAANDRPIRITNVTETGGVEIARVEHELKRRTQLSGVPRFTTGGA